MQVSEFFVPPKKGSWYGSFMDTGIVTILIGTAVVGVALAALIVRLVTALPRNQRQQMADTLRRRRPSTYQLRQRTSIAGLPRPAYPGVREGS